MPDSLFHKLPVFSFSLRNNRRGRLGNVKKRINQLERLEQRQLLATDVFIQPAIHKVIDGDNFAAPYVRSSDSAEIVADWQTVEFDPVTRTERVLPATEKDAQLLKSLENLAQTQGFNGIGDLIGNWQQPPKPPSSENNLFQNNQSGEDDRGDGKYDDPAIEKNWIIFGADGRTRVTDTTAWPYSAIGKQWQTYGSSMFVCSGALIGDFHFLTAGHCVHDGTAWADNVVVSMAQDGLPLGGTRSDDQYFGEARWTTARTFTGWTNSGNWDWDLAVVTLDRNIGNFTGHLGYEWTSSDSFFNNNNARTSGYPGDLNNATLGLGQYTQTGNIRSYGITAHQLRTNTMDTWGGQSGSSVWYPDGLRSLGVYSHSAWADQAQTIPLYNSWTRITEDKFNSINTWKDADTPPTDRADLVDHDEWFNTNLASFSPSSVPIGEPITVSARPRNNGTAAASAFSVRFRLSTNQVYDVSDHLLGDVSISSLNPFQSTIATLVTNVPSIPTGQYYLVWSIDPFASVTEFLESNNTGSTNSRVTITPPLMPDLRGWWTDAPNSNLAWGQTFQVRGQARNDGTAAVISPFYQDFFLSNDQVWGDADDILLGWYYHTASIPANGGLGTDFNITLTLPSSPPVGYNGAGTFYIGMKSDALGAIAESNETNNTPGSFNQTYDWDSFVIPSASVVSAQVVHNGWSGSGANIDTTKSLLKESSTPQTLSFDNLTNSSRGINGLQFAINSLGNPGALSTNDFIFQWSPPGAFDPLTNPASSWGLVPTAPTITVSPSTTSIVSLAWPDNTIANRWLRVTLKANANTGLAIPEVYYIGHLLGETTGPAGTVYSVSFADITPIRAGVGLAVNAGSSLDIDKNGTVSFNDISATRGNVGAQLSNMTVQSTGGGGGSEGPQLTSGSATGGIVEQQTRALHDLYFSPLVDSPRKSQPQTLTSLAEDEITLFADRSKITEIGSFKVNISQRAGIDEPLSRIVNEELSDRIELESDLENLAVATKKTSIRFFMMAHSEIFEDAIVLNDLFFEDHAEAYRLDS